MTEHDANEAFSIILKLKEPWFVENVDVTSERVNICVSTRAKALVECPLCGETCSINDRIERTDLRFPFAACGILFLQVLEMLNSMALVVFYSPAVASYKIVVNL